MISGHGSLSAPVILLADGASEEDIISGYALSGQPERVLSSFFKSHGLNWNETYRTAYIKERINLAKPMANVHLITDKYKEVLNNEINHIKPNIIVPLSELSFNYVTGLSGIRKFRGSVLPSKPEFNSRIIPVLGLHPYINEDPKMEFISRLDVGKITKNINERGPVAEYGLTWVCKTNEALRSFIDRHYKKCIAKSLDEGGYLVLDIESYVGVPTCISLCFDGYESCTVPFIDRKILLDNRVLMLHTVANLLADKQLPKANQNIKYDWHHLELFLLKVENVQGDTMLAASTLYCEFPKNLGFLNSLYTDMPYFKDEGKEFDPAVHDSERLYLYCAKDSLSTHQILKQQIAEMKETNTYGVYQQSIQLLPIYKKMEDRGICIDDTRRHDLIAVYCGRFDIQVYKLHKLIGEKINPLSDDQVRKLVYNELGYKKIRGVKTTKSGNPGTDEESLMMLMWVGVPNSNIRDNKEILQTIINCRKLHKVIEYLESPIWPDGRTRFSANLAGAETGRTTTSKSTEYYFYFDKKTIKIKNLGRSIQNVGKHGFEIAGETYGKDIRSIFIPSYGFVFVDGDLSQAEARVDAVLASDYDILSIFDGPIGIHRLTGSWIYDCPPEDIKKGVLVNGKDRYYEAKTARHAGERNMREDRLMMMINQPIKECIRILRKFHENQPNIRDVFHKEIREIIQKTRNLTAPNGRRRDFFGRFDTHMINEGISFLPQAIVTDYLKQGLLKVFSNIDWAHLLMESHDGHLVEIPMGRQMEYGELFKKAVEVPIDFRTCTLSRDFQLVIPCEIEWSNTNWQEMKGLTLGSS